MASDIEIYESLKRPPKWALREIKAGDLKGKTDINPQWRYEAMTKAFGLVGVGWKYTIDKLWTEEGANDETLCFAQVSVYITNKELEYRWSDPIIGIGGSKLVNNFSTGLKSNDEGYKMAVTDAFSTALKMLGVAGDIYAGKWDGSKYTNIEPETNDDKQDGQQASGKIKAEAELVVKKFKELAGEGYIEKDSLEKMEAAYKKLKTEKDYSNFIEKSRRNIASAEAEKQKKFIENNGQSFDDDEIPFEK